MKDKDKIVNERLEKISEVFFKMSDIIDSLPNEVPKPIKEFLKDKILQNAELRRLMRGIEESRPPKLLLVGRTGVGKSSLINAICGFYAAPISDVVVGTKETEIYQCYKGEDVILEFLDSRGIGESYYDDEAEKQLKKDIKLEHFNPDMIVFVLRCKARDRIQEDIKYVKGLRREYEKNTGKVIPVIVVLNQTDELAPATERFPSEYSLGKLDNISLAKEEMKKLLIHNELEFVDVIPVSSLVTWERTSTEINQLSKSEWIKVKIKEDGRYQIEELVKCMSDNLTENASMGLLMASDNITVSKRLAEKMILIFASISSAVAVNPIPFSDIFPLYAIQILCVFAVGYIAGEEMNVKTSIKFVEHVMGVGLGGQLFRLTAKQISKIIPFAGGAVNAVVAYSGTKLIGELAIQHYICGVSTNKLKDEYKKSVAKRK